MAAPDRDDEQTLATARYEPPYVMRDVDIPRPSAYPETRRFSTIYPGTRASDEATNAALRAARQHDRSSSNVYLDLLAGRDDGER